MSYKEKLIRLIAFIVIVTINYNEWFNIHNPKQFIFGDIKFPKIDLMPYLQRKKKVIEGEVNEEEKEEEEEEDEDEEEELKEYLAVKEDL